MDPLVLARRTLLQASGPVLLVACSQGAVALTPAVIISEASAIGKGLSGMLVQLAALYPALIPPATLATINDDLDLAQSSAATLANTLPAASGAATVQSVLGDVNAALDLFAGPPINGLIPAPFNMAVAAAAILAPELDVFVTQYIPTASASPKIAATRAKLKATAPQVTTPAQALAILQKYSA